MALHGLEPVQFFLQRLGAALWSGGWWLMGRGSIWVRQKEIRRCDPGVEPRTAAAASV